MELFGYELNLVLRELFKEFVFYFGFASAAYLLFYVLMKRAWAHKRIQADDSELIHLRHEIFWSSLGRIIAAGASLVLIRNAGQWPTSIYSSIPEMGLVYFCISPLIIITLHDAYFYWMHRLLHVGLLYTYIHKVHHHSTQPTPYAAYSFHPLETLGEVLFFVLLLFFVPLHPAVILVTMIFTILWGVYLHLGFEFMPRNWLRNPIFKFINTPTNHDLHHQHFHYNFGLYFNYWDRMFGTLDPQYEEIYDQIKSRPTPE